jgi:hypothetical protein
LPSTCKPNRLSTPRGFLGERLHILSWPVRAGRNTAGAGRAAHAATRRSFEAPEVRERLQALGADPLPTTAQELNRMVDREIRENIDLARKADIRLQ